MRFRRSPFKARGVMPFTGRVELRKILLGPSVEDDEGFAQGHAERTESVFDVQRDGLKIMALDQAISFQGLQGLGQHLLRYAANPAQQGSVSVRRFRQRRNDQDAPFPRDELQRMPG